MSFWPTPTSDRKATAAPTYAYLYATMLPRLVEIANTHGYCLALHGSMARDLDLLCVPWVEDVQPAEELVEALAAAFCWFGERGVDGIQGPTQKPHGRRAWSIVLGGRAYIDVSVMPRVESWAREDD